MALTAQFQNHIVRLQQMAEELVAIQHRIRVLEAEWHQNSMFTLLTDEDIALHFPHLTKGKVIEAINAIAAVDTALGNYSGDPVGKVVNLLKLRA
ncbi:hypothetical protein FBQ95_17055 [Chloroflexi bacterium CFX3]|nr:hypothetical protein [Chloroflexi bacterium CFX3]